MEQRVDKENSDVVNSPFVPIPTKQGVPRMTLSLSPTNHTNGYEPKSNCSSPQKSSSDPPSDWNDNVISHEPKSCQATELKPSSACNHGSVVEVDPTVSPAAVSWSEDLGVDKPFNGRSAIIY